MRALIFVVLLRNEQMKRTDFSRSRSLYWDDRDRSGLANRRTSRKLDYKTFASAISWTFFSPLSPTPRACVLHRYDDLDRG